MTFNAITGLAPTAFRGLAALQELFAPLCTWSCITCCHRLLPYNRISSLPPGVFSGLTSLQSLFDFGTAWCS